MLFRTWGLRILLLAVLSGALASASAGPSDPGDPFGLRDLPVIDRFRAEPECIAPDPRRGIISYSVSNGVTRVRVNALHAGGRVRTFHTQASRTPAPAMAASGVADPGAAADIEAYVLVATGVRGAEVSRRVPFLYRKAVFELVPPARHLGVTVGGDSYTRYESDARVAHVDSLSCSFRFDAPIAGESGRPGAADIWVGDWPRPIARCDIAWRDARKARAGGTVEWIARVTDRCTQGRITRAARVNAIR